VHRLFGNSSLRQPHLTPAVELRSFPHTADHQPRNRHSGDIRGASRTFSRCPRGIHALARSFSPR